MRRDKARWARRVDRADPVQGVAAPAPPAARPALRRFVPAPRSLSKAAWRLTQRSQSASSPIVPLAPPVVPFPVQNVIRILRRLGVALHGLNSGPDSSLKVANKAGP